MRSASRKLAVTSAIFCVAVLLLPVLVSAEVQTRVTEVVSLPAASDDNDAVRNMANSTIISNRDTWTPLPEGMFVGGSIEESIMSLNELPIGTSTLLVSTQMEFQRSYLMNGASQFVVRLPFVIEHPWSVWFVKLDVYDITLTGEILPTFQGAGFISPPMVWINSTTGIMASYSDVANFWEHIGNPTTQEIWTDVSHNSWLSDKRLYVRLVCPVLVDHIYQFSCRMTMNESTPMEIAWHPSDLASDNITSTRVAYIWNEAIDLWHQRDYVVPADAGWSFVFQIGLGNTATDWNYFYGARQKIVWDKYVPVSSGTCTGGFTFILEFRTNYTVDLEYDLNITAIDDVGGSNVVVLHGGGGNYWHEMFARDALIAARPENITYPTVTINGVTAVHIRIELRVINAVRIQIMMEADAQIPQNDKMTVYEPNGVTIDQIIWFSPWCTCLIQDSVYNETWTAMIKKAHKPFWSGVSSWWDEHWIDVANVLILGAGMFLMAIPGCQGFGLALIAMSIGIFLYDNVDWVRNLVNGAIGMVLDGLKWLGNWLYKIGMWLWKALTWLFEQIVYYGGILIGLLIIAVAIGLFIGPIYALVKIMGAFLMMAQGDYEKAAAQISGIVATGKSVVARLRPGGGT
jgi:hypothetical protein